MKKLRMLKAKNIQQNKAKEVADIELSCYLSNSITIFEHCFLHIFNACIRWRGRRWSTTKRVFNDLSPVFLIKKKHKFWVNSTHCTKLDAPLSCDDSSSWSLNCLIILDIVIRIVLTNLKKYFWKKTHSGDFYINTQLLLYRNACFIKFTNECNLYKQVTKLISNRAIDIDLGKNNRFVKQFLFPGVNELNVGSFTESASTRCTRNENREIKNQIVVSLWLILR